VLNELFQRWTNNLSQLREIAVAIIQFGNYKNNAILRILQGVGEKC